MVAMMIRELGPFYVEAETHKVEAISIQTSDASIQYGRSMNGGAL